MPQKPDYDRAHVPMGEEMDSARWSLPPIVPVLIAFAVLAAIFGSYAYRQRPGIISQGSIDAFKTFPIHTESARLPQPEGMVATPETYDQLLIMAHVTIKDLNAKTPLYIKSIDAKLVTGTDAGDLSATQSTHGDQEQFFGYYKQLADFQIPPISAEQKINPGQSFTGLAMFSLGVTPEVWKNRKDFTITVSFYDQNPIVLHAPAGS
ncbi:MAG: hypothetical protein NVS9B15_02290 [Acidobacteriaceae bacterium]